jgi:2-dehydropantoate 2-reductase
MSNLTYAIIGPGALGGLYGARLQHAGLETHFLFHTDCDHVRQHGLRVESPWGNVHLPQVHAYDCVDDLPQCDVICVCLKSTQNHLLPQLLPPLTRPGAAVILMQNGLGAEEEVAALLPQAKLAGGLCYLCSNKVGPGHIKHLDYGRVAFGAHSSGMEEVLNQVAADFAAGGVPVEVTANLAEQRWRKLGWNVPYNGLSVVLNAQTDAIMNCPETRELSRQLMVEVLAGARACGHNIEPGFVDKLLDFTQKMKAYSTSMKLDYEAGRPMEIEYMYERPLQAARRAGVDLPRVATLTAQLRFLNHHE